MVHIKSPIICRFFDEISVYTNSYNSTPIGDYRYIMTDKSHSPSISALSHNLEDTLDLTNMFIKMLQEEMVTNASFRGKVDQSLNNIQDMVDTIQEVVIEGNGHSLVSKIERMEYSVEAVESKITSLKEQIEASLEGKKAEEARKTERFWNLVAQNSPVILTWMAGAAWFAVQFFTKKP
jgi:hypothetical protein